MPRSTKQDIVYQLTELLKERRLDEITVKDLTERCKISRQAFYYHFSDIYNVVEWGVQQELERLVEETTRFLLVKPEKVVWEEVLEQAEEKMLANRAIVLNTYRSFERSYVNHRLMNIARPVMEQELERIALQFQVTQEQVDFIAELLTMCLVNIFLNWLDVGLPNRNMEHLDDFQVAISGSAEDMLRRLEQKNKSKK